ncbi:hypothetical protein [Streptomyces sp. NPDC090022]|uniref:hypothetical protein n=1 Tax=Streptomyces sp. NPDC090022 TaxID=3365920 RepID=UPI00382B2AF6
MDARVESTSFEHTDHLLIGHQVVDTRSLREGELRAVVIEKNGDLTAYIRGADAREFETPLECVRRAS